MNQIIRESGTPKALFYYYFPNGKEELAIASVEYISQKVINQIEEGFAYSDDPYIAIDRFMTNIIIRGFMEKESERGFQLSCWRQSQSRKTRSSMPYAKQEMIRWQELVKEKLMEQRGMKKTKRMSWLLSFTPMVIGGLSMTTASNKRPL
ncbi:TetR/AcrR family transcriptional regulator [Paenibacillus sp. JTLBN-2024]